MRLLELLCLIPVVTACGIVPVEETSGGPECEISSDLLSGAIDGQPWTFAAGEADSSGSSHRVSMWASDFSPCDPGFATGPRVLLSIPNAVGEYELDLSRTMTFVIEREMGYTLNRIVADGTIRVDEISSGVIRGGVCGTFEEGTDWISGMYEIAMCSN